MNGFYLAAGLLSLASAALHGIGGEWTILRKVATSAFPTMPNGDGAQAKAETRMTWHALTVYFALAGVLLLLMAFDRLQPAAVIGQLTALHYAAWAVLVFCLPSLTLRDPRAAIRSPQWALLLLLAGLTFGGTLGGTR